MSRIGNNPIGIPSGVEFKNLDSKITVKGPKGELKHTLPDGIELKIETFDNLAVDAARSCGAGVIIRGLRDASDFDYEVQMGQRNAAMAPDIETVFLAAGPGTRMIASSLVRQIAGMNGIQERLFVTSDGYWHYTASKKRCSTPSEALEMIRTPPGHAVHIDPGTANGVGTSTHFRALSALQTDRK